MEGTRVSHERAGEKQGKTPPPHLPLAEEDPSVPLLGRSVIPSFEEPQSSCHHFVFHAGDCEMVNKLRRFFRSLSGKSSPSPDPTSAPSSWRSSDIPLLGGDEYPIGSGPYGSSSAVGFRPRLNIGSKTASRRNLKSGEHELSFDSLLLSSASSSSTSASPAKPESSRSGIKWARTLGKIPKIVADATTASQNVASPDEHKASDDEHDNQENDGVAGVSAASIHGLLQLRDILSQMVSNSDFRDEIRVFYYGQMSSNGACFHGKSLRRL